MTTEEDFLAAILAEPGEDLHRLVYADWLTDRGWTGDAERAEFIRVQCKLAKLPPADDSACHGGSSHRMYLRFMKADCRWCDLEYRQRCLFGEHGDGWFADLNARFDNDVCLSCVPLDDSETDNYRACVEVRRGFVVKVHCSCESWRDHGPDIVVAHPVEFVQLADVRVNNYAGRIARWDSWHPDPPAGSEEWPWLVGVAAWPNYSESARWAAISAAALTWAREEPKMRVELHVFSGRRDPRWTLTTDEAARLQELLRGLPATNEPEPVPFHLGYRGLVACGSGANLRVYREHVVVAREGAAEKHLRDEGRTVENFLLTTGAPHIPGGVLTSIRCKGQS